MPKIKWQSGKVAVVILAILFILSLVGAVIGFYSFQEERLRVLTLNVELKELQVEKRIIEDKLTESEMINSDLEDQLGNTLVQVEELSSELEQGETERIQLNSQIEKLQAQLREEEKIKKELEAQKTQAQDQINRLQAILKISKEELESQLNKFSTGQEVALGKIVVGQKEEFQESVLEGGPDYVAIVSPSASNIIEGEVLVVDKDYDFAVVNLGSQDGINIGDRLLVYHNSSYIGDIQIEKAQEVMSACGFLSENIEDIIKEGDKVIKR
ncbi:MAG: hypothetical protein PVI33_05960 [Candidatus Omnitrophota bacterium]|jgi:predicted RNase H-like nuclease (RuvC/YqgF family)